MIDIDSYLDMANVAAVDTHRPVEVSKAASDINQVRAAFEAWYSDKFPTTPIEMLRGEGSYWHKHTYGCWLAYQAATDAKTKGGHTLLSNQLINNLLGCGDAFERPDGAGAFWWRNWIMDELGEVKLPLNTDDKGGQGWVKCSERLPTVDDADENGKVWYLVEGTSHIIECHFESFVRWPDEFTNQWHPKPKSVKPAPPQEASSD